MKNNFFRISKSCTQLLMICTGDECNFDCSSPLPLLCTTSTTLPSSSPSASTSPSSSTDTPPSLSTMIQYNLSLITFCAVLFKIKSLINV
uniref:Uncharacterized protein n=1 Tax=Panagrolaimus sp. PS1159 TaxID=55785 RepID=A0AC35GRA4_9BILA